MKKQFTITHEFVKPKSKADRIRRRRLFAESVVDCLQQQHSKKYPQKKKQ